MTKWTFKSRSKEFILEKLDATPKDETCFGCQGKRIEGKSNLCWHCVEIFAQGFDLGCEFTQKESIKKDILREKIDNYIKKTIKDLGEGGSIALDLLQEELLQELLNTKEGKEVMVCAVEGCGEIDESHSAYCIKHGRSTHRMIKEDGACR